MTAYGRSVRSSSLGKWLIEVYSVNKKTLDFNIFIPKDLLQFDLEIRKTLSKFMRRGQVTVKVSFCQSRPAFEIMQQIEYLKSMKKEMEKACKELDCSNEEITFPFLYEQVRELICVDLSKQEGELWSDLQSGLEEAIQGCMKMRQVEGASLAEAFQKNLAILEQLLAQVKEQLVGIEDRYRKKILEKLQSYKELMEEDRERVLREVFFYAEKSDVEEEIIRMSSHIRQFHTLLASDEVGHGRTMDFLIQEMGREVNTLSSKSDDLEGSYLILKMKAELEKIREQAQNVE